jgi:hypothetical protein
VKFGSLSSILFTSEVQRESLLLLDAPLLNK